MWPAMLVTAPMVVLTWCLLPNHEIACPVVVLSMPVLVPLLIRRPAHGMRDIAMVCMVGGTLCGWGVYGRG